MKGNGKIGKAVVALTLTAISAYAVNAWSQQAKPETIVKQRQAAMTLQGKYFYGHLRPMAQGKLPYDAKVVANDALLLDALAKMPWDDFTAATKDVKSAATPAVFSDTAKFKEAQDRFQSEVARLVSLTKGNDEAAVKAQI